MTDEVARKIAGSASDAKARAKSDQLSRKNAATILKPSEVRGEYDANRLLMTTLGGEKRVMTHEDLAAFRRNASIAGKAFVGGITARQVIDQSLKIDRDRARKEIRWAIPAYAGPSKRGNLMVQFNTDASGRNGASRHYVQVEFLGYQTALVSGADAPAKAARIMSSGKIRFDCDCGRHTYWYRYISTVGNFNSGRAETGYPKIRNPNMVGVGCKHVLRVMAEIEGSVFTMQFLARQIQAARLKGEKARIRSSQKDADKQIDKQSKRSTNQLDSREERDLHRSRLALRKTTQAARKNMAKPKVIAGGSRKIQQLGRLGIEGKNAETMLLQIIQGLGITREQAISMLTKK